MRREFEVQIEVRSGAAHSDVAHSRPWMLGLHSDLVEIAYVGFSTFLSTLLQAEIAWLYPLHLWPSGLLHTISHHLTGAYE